MTHVIVKYNRVNRNRDGIYGTLVKKLSKSEKTLKM